MAFAREMERVLRENDHKGDWRDPYCTLDYLASRFEDEALEAITEMRSRKFGTNHCSYSPECRGAILKELADCANFAMMIADIMGTMDEQEEGASDG